MRCKTATMGDHSIILYKSDRWDMLSSLSKKAASIMYALQDAGLDGLVHGSVARGDISSGSDIDIVIPWVVQSFRVELALEPGIVARKVVVD